MPASLLYKWVAAPVPPPPLSPPPVYSADDIANWDVQINGVFVDATEPPDGDDHLLFVGSASNLNCTVPASGGSMGGGLPGSPPPPPSGPPLPRAFASITETDGYAGIVDFQCSVFVGVLNLTGGPTSGIAQNDAYQYAQNQTGGHVSVTSAFTWNAGSINDGSLAPKLAFFNLWPGATGTATPTADSATSAGQVSVGSIFTVMGTSPTQRAELTLNEGVYRINCSLGFSVIGALAIAAPVPKDNRPYGMVELEQGNVTLDKTTQAATKGIVSVDVGGTATIKSAPLGTTDGERGKVLFHGEDPTLDNRGEVVIRDGIQLHFKPKGDGNPPPDAGLLQRRASVPGGGFDTNQKLSIESGCEILCEGKTKVTIDHGTIELKEAKTGLGVPHAIQSQVRIKAQAVAGVMADRTLDIGAGGALLHPQATVPVHLYIDGVFRCRGEMQLFAKRNQAGVNDTITAEKQIEFVEDTELTVTWFGPAVGSAFGHTWTLIHSKSPAAAPINVLPTCHPPFLPPATDNPEMHLSDDSKTIYMDRLPN